MVKDVISVIMCTVIDMTCSIAPATCVTSFHKEHCLYVLKCLLVLFRTLLETLHFVSGIGCV